MSTSNKKQVTNKKGTNNKNNTKNSKNNKVSNTKPKEFDGIDSLLSSSVFDDDKTTKKTDVRTLSNTKVLPKKSEVVIDMENDTSEEKIEKLITLVQILQKELNDFQTYAEGTYCTYAVHNNFSTEIENKIDKIVSDIEDM